MSRKLVEQQKDVRRTGCGWKMATQFHKERIILLLVILNTMKENCKGEHSSWEMRKGPDKEVIGQELIDTTLILARHEEVLTVL